MEASDSFVPTGWSSEELDIVDKIIGDHMEAMNNSEFWPKTLPQLWAGFSKMWKDISAKLNEHGFQRSVQEVTHHFEKCVSISPQEPPAESDSSNANPNSMRSTVDEERIREMVARIAGPAREYHSPYPAITGSGRGGQDSIPFQSRSTPMDETHASVTRPANTEPANNSHITQDDAVERNKKIYRKVVNTIQDMKNKLAGWEAEHQYDIKYLNDNELRLKEWKSLIRATENANRQMATNIRDRNAKISETRETLRKLEEGLKSKRIPAPKTPFGNGDQ